MAIPPGGEPLLQAAPTPAGRPGKGMPAAMVPAVDPAAFAVLLAGQGTAPAFAPAALAAPVPPANRPGTDAPALQDQAMPWEALAAAAEEAGHLLALRQSMAMAPPQADADPLPDLATPLPPCGPALPAPAPAPALALAPAPVPAGGPGLAEWSAETPPEAAAIPPPGEAPAPSLVPAAADAAPLPDEAAAPDASLGANADADADANVDAEADAQPGASAEPVRAALAIVPGTAAMPAASAPRPVTDGPSPALALFPDVGASALPTIGAEPPAAAPILPATGEARPAPLANTARPQPRRPSGEAGPPGLATPAAPPAAAGAAPPPEAVALPAIVADSIDPLRLAPPEEGMAPLHGPTKVEGELPHRRVPVPDPRLSSTPEAAARPEPVLLAAGGGLPAPALVAPDPAAPRALVQAGAHPRLAAEAAPQIVLRVREAAEQGVDTIAVDLRPPELGRVELRLTFREGTVQVVMLAERAETFEALRQERHSLMQQMEQAGLQLGGNGLDLQHGSLSWAEREAREPEPAPAMAAAAGEEEGPPAAEASRRVPSDSLIDIVA
ncbi:hypothetical protein CR162_17210 [Pseudoroseomonas rhizosphaerae]|uniref:Flagellar hook-length control protein-like C-terminal domain-containing protein n=1 Tax=Teichococcus rhizosphaerae TaxID=1335062 RepID=A0A2C7A9L7_9PROT|nr:flagellar hook-length control protein FliK [Pseudoroseomonas rhizosphaerae]PHK93726.1 hypothetical protein CR162_17210 [Pseudoroseomonas rhizosphaerae]